MVGEKPDDIKYQLQINWIGLQAISGNIGVSNTYPVKRISLSILILNPEIDTMTFSTLMQNCTMHRRSLEGGHCQLA